MKKLLLALLFGVPAFAGYSGSSSITIHHTQVASDQTNFPVLISLSAANYLKTTANGGSVVNGADIAFTSDQAGNNLLNFEVTKYDGTAGSLIAWVNVPTVSASTDTVIYLQYGNAAVSTSPQNRIATWNSNYVSVFHFGDSTSGTPPQPALDSTGHETNSSGLSQNVSYTTGGEYYGAVSFTGSSKIYVADDQIQLWMNAPLTVEVWFNIATTSSTGYALVSHQSGAGANGYTVVATNNTIRTNFMAGFSVNATSAVTFTTGSWHHYVITTDASSNYTQYLDGVAQGSGVKSWTQGINYVLELGTTNGSNLTPLVGLMDEIRASNNIRGSDYVAATYKNIATPAAFYSVANNNGGTQTIGQSGASPTLTSIAVTPANGTLTIGSTQQYVATGTYSDASTAVITNSVTWASATTGVATINSTGLATAVAQGTSNLTATLGNIVGSTTVTVPAPSAPTLTSIAVTPASGFTLNVGSTQQYIATGTYSDSSTQVITSTVSWSSGTPGVATISSGGVVTAVAQGNSTITATLNTVSGSASMTVPAQAGSSAHTMHGCPGLPANNVFNTPIDTLPVQPNSAAWITNINNFGGPDHLHPDFGYAPNEASSDYFNYLIPAGTPKVPISFLWYDTADETPFVSWWPWMKHVSSTKQWPIPVNAPVEGAMSPGGDAHLYMEDTTNCWIYEPFYVTSAATGWQPNAAFTLGTAIVDYNGHIQQVTIAGTSQTFRNPPNWSFQGGTTSDGSVTWQDLGQPAWAANHAYTLGSLLYFPQTVHIQQVTTAGTSGSSAPSWNLSGGNTADGTVVWKDLGTPGYPHGAYSDGSWAATSGAVWDLTSNALPPDGWTSGSASSLPTMQTFITWDEVASGSINHALFITDGRNYSMRNAHIWPARHDVGDATAGDFCYQNQNCAPFGARIRLKASFDVSPFSQTVRVILNCLKKYGAIVMDNGDINAAWFIPGISNPNFSDTDLAFLKTFSVSANMEFVDESSLMVNPDSMQVTPDPMGQFAGKVAITVNHAKVPNTDQSNFPVLVSLQATYLKSARNGGSVARYDGADITFTSDSAGYNRMTFEMEKYDETTGSVIAWVKVPTLSHTTDTVFYLQYGQANITVSQQSRTATWDSNFTSVFHFGAPWPMESASLGVIKPVWDSTNHENLGSNTVSNVSYAGTGEYSQSASFNGSSSILIGDTQQGFLWQNPPLTIEVWFNIATPNATGYPLVSHQSGAGANGYTIVATDNTIRTNFLAGFGVNATTAVTFTLGAWHHYVVTTDVNNNYVQYLDGVQQGTGTAAYTHIGYNLMFGTTGGSNLTPLVGLLDEIRGSNIIRSGDYVATTYNNLSSPGTFYTAVNGGSGGGVTPPPPTPTFIPGIFNNPMTTILEN